MLRVFSQCLRSCCGCGNGDNDSRTPDLADLLRDDTAVELFPRRPHSAAHAQMIGLDSSPDGVAYGVKLGKCIFTNCDTEEWSGSYVGPCDRFGQPLARVSSAKVFYPDGNMYTGRCHNGLPSISNAVGGHWIDGNTWSCNNIYTQVEGLWGSVIRNQVEAVIGIEWSSRSDSGAIHGTVRYIGPIKKRDVGEPYMGAGECDHIPDVNALQQEGAGWYMEVRNGRSGNWDTIFRLPLSYIQPATSIRGHTNVTTTHSMMV